MRAYFAVFAAVLVLGCTGIDPGRGVTGGGETKEVKALTKQAVETGNLTVCTLIAGRDWAYACGQEVGRKLKDADACQGVNDTGISYSCLAGTAQSLQSMKPCQMIEDVVQRDWCQKEMARAQEN